MGNQTEYPALALFDVQNDPGETVNLAYSKKELVKKLFIEAKKEIELAPAAFIGDLVDTKGPQINLNLFEQQNTNGETVVPYSPWMEDSELEENGEISEGHGERLTRYFYGGDRNTVLWHLSAVFVLWAVIPLILLYGSVLVVALLI